MNIFKKMVSLLLSLLIVLGCTCAVAEGDEWVCPACGAANTSNFCTKCGTQRPAEVVCPGCGAKIPIDSGAVFCGNCGTKLPQAASVSVRYEGEGFASPEEALTCYMEGLKNLDFEQMLAAFAWETQVEHYDLKASLQRIGAYLPTTRPGMPSINDFLFSANVNAIRSYQADLIYRAIEMHILGDDSPANTANGMITFRKDTDDIDVFLQKFDNGRVEKLTQLTNIRFMTPDEATGGKFSEERTQETFARQTAFYGADEAVNLIGVADVGDETLYCCPTICRYGSRWYLVSVSSVTSALLGVYAEQQAFICGAGGL